MQTISILGTGWLGLPLAEQLAGMGHQLKASTTSSSRLAQLAALDLQPYVVDIANLGNEVSEDGEGGDHLQAVLGKGGAGEGQGCGGGRSQGSTDCPVRWRP